MTKPAPSTPPHDHRSARVRRHLAKRPPTVEVVHDHDDAAQANIVDLLSALLAKRST